MALEELETVLTCVVNYSCAVFFKITPSNNTSEATETDEN